MPNTSAPTGVMVIGTFSSNFSQFQVLAKEGIDSLLDQGAEYLVIDVTNNGGGYVSQLAREMSIVTESIGHAGLLGLLLEQALRRICRGSESRH